MPLLAVLLAAALASDDPAEAFFRALTGDGSDARIRLAVCFLYGYGTRVRLSRGAELLPADSTIRTQPDAPYFLPDRAMTDNELFAYARKQAEAGSVPAWRILAFCHCTGRGTKRSPASAIRCWRKASEMDDPASTALLMRLLPDDEMTARMERIRAQLKNLPPGKELFLPELLPSPVPGKKILRLGEQEPVREFLRRVSLSGPAPAVMISVSGI